MHYLKDSESIQNLASIYRNHLNKTIDFWTQNAIDYEEGGYFCHLDREGNIIDTDKGVWQTGRFAWLLAHLYNNYDKSSQWLKLAKHGIDFLAEHGFDKDGKMFFHLNRAGEPVRKRRYAFSESFAVLAWAEYAKATQNNKFADRAIELFNNYIKFNTNKKYINPKYIEAIRPTKGIGYPMIGIATAQILRETVNYQKADRMIQKWVDEIKTDHLNSEYKAVVETVGPNGEFIDHVRGRTLNPGHAIEAAWFIMKEGKYRKDSRTIDLGTKMLDWMWEIGWDKEYGGILYFKDVKGHPVQEYWHDMKFWWPHCEAIIASLMAYNLTGDKKYAQMHKLVHDWTFNHFPDDKYGEWFGYLHRDGRISVDSKGNIWKGPFHIPRMLFISLNIVDEILQKKS